MYIYSLDKAKNSNDSIWNKTMWTWPAGDTVTWWLALTPYSKKVPGLKPGAFQCVSRHSRMNFLQFSIRFPLLGTKRVKTMDGWLDKKTFSFLKKLLEEIQNCRRNANRTKTKYFQVAALTEIPLQNWTGYSSANIVSIHQSLWSTNRHRRRLKLFSTGYLDVWLCHEVLMESFNLEIEKLSKLSLRQPSECLWIKYKCYEKKASHQDWVTH